MRLVNLCRKRITLLPSLNGQSLTLEGAEHPVEMRVRQLEPDEISTDTGPVLVAETQLEVKNLPPPADDTLFVVPWEVVMFFKHRVDLVSINGTVLSTVRDKEGKVVGYRSLQRLGG